MHQDQRIGLALAVLLLGAAGAFFFRHDPKPAGPSANLKTGAELDARIAEKSISPYLQSTDRVTSARNVSDHQSVDDGSLPRLDSPDFFTDADSSPLSDAGLQELAPIPFSDANDGGSTGAHVVGNGRPAATAEKTHIVQKGETLSSIAAKELGSSGRYQELFEANRDQLKDANDVRIGMTLQIPAKSPRLESTTARSGGRVHTAPSLLPANSNRADVGDLPTITVDPDQQRGSPRTSEPHGNKRLFEPAKRPPLGVKAPGTQSSQSEPAKPSRKLSQLPPKEGSGKVAR